MKIFNPQSNINYRELRMIVCFNFCIAMVAAKIKNACTNCASGGAEKNFKTANAKHRNSEKMIQ